MDSDKSKIMKEKDEILEGILHNIQRSDTAKDNIIIRGGAALHFFYSSPRYSDDVDGNIPDFLMYKEAIKKDLMEDIVFEDKIYKSALRKDQPYFFRISYSQNKPNSPVGRVELDKDGSPKKYKKSEGKYAPIMVEEPSEIYADKVVATFHRMFMRDSMKASDLFDLDYLANVLKTTASNQEITEKSNSFRNYGWNHKVLDKIMLFINDKNNHIKFKKDLEKCMLPDFFETQKFDSEYFEKTSQYFNSLKSIFEKSEQLTLFDSKVAKV